MNPNYESLTQIGTYLKSGGLGLEFEAIDDANKRPFSDSNKMSEKSNGR